MESHQSNKRKVIIPSPDEPPLKRQRVSNPLIIPTTPNCQMAPTVPIVPTIPVVPTIPFVPTIPILPTFPNYQPSQLFPMGSIYGTMPMRPCFGRMPMRSFYGMMPMRPTVPNYQPSANSIKPTSSIPIQKKEKKPIGTLSQNIILN